MEACHSAEQFNVTLYAATTVAIVTLEVFAGMWINAFIVSVICMSWVRKKTLNSNEKILLVLGYSRFWFLCILWVISFLAIIYSKHLHGHLTRVVVVSIFTFLNYFNLCVSASLYVFYCVKISNFRNSFFIYLKVKLDRIVPWLLLGSGLFALATTILAYAIGEKLHSEDRNSTCSGNFWEENIKVEERLFHTYFVPSFGYAASFMAVIFSSLLLLFSLWRHKRNMQTNSMKDLSMATHIKAMKSILSFFVMYSVNFICLIFTVIYSVKNEPMFLVLVYLCGFPGVHSLILIFSNPKLKDTLLRILPCVKCKARVR